MSENWNGHQSDERGFCVRGDGRWPCDYAEKCQELAAERERREQAERERDELRRIVDSESPIGALDLATTWRTERAQYQERMARLEAALLPLLAIAKAAVTYYPDCGVLCNLCGWYATKGVAHDRGCPVVAWEAAARTGIITDLAALARAAVKIEEEVDHANT